MENFRKYIRNILLEDLSGGYEHQNDEIVTFDKIDLQKEYSKLNQLLFNGELPSINVEWDKRKGAHGSVHAIKNRYGLSVINGLYMSKFFKIPYWAFKNVLAHEMIHVKNISNSIDDHWYGKRNPHGHHFEKEMNRINSLGLGFKITKIGLGEELDGNTEVSDHIKEKERKFCLLKYKKNTGLYGYKDKTEYGVLIFPNNGSFESARYHIKNIFDNSTKSGRYSGVELVFGDSMDRNFLLYSVRRNIGKRIVWNTIDETKYEKLLSLTRIYDRTEFGNIEKKPETVSDTPLAPTKKETLSIDPNSQEGKDALVAQFRKEQNRATKEKLYDIIQERNPQEKQRLYDEYISNHGEFA